MSDRIHVRMAYVVLHYNSIEETRACVRSIQQTAAFPDSAVVVVDNASPNGTGKTLKEEYNSVPSVEVILNDVNAGFSRGNNIGWWYVRDRYDADFVTVCNNDVTFPSADYVERVERAYSESPFEVLGPDVFQTTLGIHQSPLGLSAPDEKAVRRTIRLNALAKRFFSLFWLVFGRGELRRIQTRGDSMDQWNTPMRDVPLMGACLVFSRRFVAEREKAFEPETFLYYEEYLLWHACMKRRYRMAYRPEIQVLHNEGRATSSEARSERDRYRRMVGHTLDAAKVYLEELKRA